MTNRRPKLSPGRAGPSRLGYVLKAFTRISETFILNEILELERQGFDLRIYSLNRPRDTKRHRLAGQVQSPVTYLPEPLLRATPAVALAHVKLLLRSPADYLVTLGQVLISCDPDLVERFIQAGFLAHLLERDGVCHLHAGFVHSPGSVAWLLYLLIGLPFSVATHAKDLYHSPPRLLRKKLASARVVFTCTRYNVGHLRRMAGPAGIRRLRQIYHGTDLERFPFGLCGLADPPLILAVARLVKKKGLQYLIRGCAVLRSRGRRFRCRIIGAGPLHKDLLRLIRSEGLEETVSLEGALEQEQVIDWYRQAAVLALPSIVTSDGDRDGIPNVLVEAAAIGLPIVSTPVSGIPELVHDAETGLLVPPHDPTALADAIERLLDSPELRERLRAAARTTVEREFDLRRNALIVGNELRMAMQAEELSVAPVELSRGLTLSRGVTT